MGSEPEALLGSLVQAWGGGAGFLPCKMSQTHPTSWDRSKWKDLVRTFCHGTFLKLSKLIQCYCSLFSSENLITENEQNLL